MMSFNCITMLAILLVLVAVTIAMPIELHRLHTDPIRRQNNVRYRRLQNGKVEVIPLHLGMGTHYTWVYAGTPPQRASVIVDTGSHIMAFPCKGCDQCGHHTDNPFDTSTSSTLTFPQCSISLPFMCDSCESNNMCNIRQLYAEGSSWNAVVVEDIVWLGTSSNNPTELLNERFGTKFMFGCQNHETGLFVSQIADGIMGVSAKGTSLIRKLSLEKKLPSNSFSLCFTSNGGYMSLGSAETSRHTGSMVYAKVEIQNEGWFGVIVKDIRIGGQSINTDLSALNGRKHVIVDSGTTDSYLPYSIRDDFLRAFRQVSGKAYNANDNGPCENGFTLETVRQMPTMQYVLEGKDGNEVIYEIQPTQYFEKDYTANYCGSIFLSEDSGGVIGANLMMNHEVFFDPDHQRIGFVSANCDFAGFENANVVPKETAQTPLPSTDVKVSIDTTTIPSNKSLPTPSSTTKATNKTVSPATAALTSIPKNATGKTVIPTLSSKTPKSVNASASGSNQSSSNATNVSDNRNSTTTTKSNNITSQSSSAPVTNSTSSNGNTTTITKPVQSSTSNGTSVQATNSTTTVKLINKNSSADATSTKEARESTLTTRSSHATDRSSDDSGARSQSRQSNQSTEPQTSHSNSSDSINFADLIKVNASQVVVNEIVRNQSMDSTTLGQTYSSAIPSPKSTKLAKAKDIINASQSSLVTIAGGSLTVIFLVIVWRFFIRTNSRDRQYRFTQLEQSEWRHGRSNHVETEESFGNLER